MKRILLTIAYDGTNYSGWQKQKDEAVITVEGELTKALRLLFRNPALECIGASRTDAGVHALGQRAVIDVETSIPAAVSYTHLFATNRSPIITTV